MRSVFFLVMVSAAACSPYDPDLGDSPFLCGPADQSPRCPDGYTCEMGTNGVEYCLAPQGMVPIDANHLNCADDTNLEPNDTREQAWITPMLQSWMPVEPPTTPPTVTFRLAGLAICPAGDKDLYSITITTTGQNLEMFLTYDPANAPLQGQILNSGGTSINDASPIVGSDGRRRAYVANLPAGVYYASVAGPPEGSLLTNNYSLTFNVIGP